MRHTNPKANETISWVWHYGTEPSATTGFVCYSMIFPAVFTEVETPVTNLCSVERDGILKKIKSDMEFAVQWVAEDNSRGRISKGACYHLLAKICLTLGDFDEAIKATNAVIDGGRYSLMTNRFRR